VILEMASLTGREISAPIDHSIQVIDYSGWIERVKWVYLKLRLHYSGSGRVADQVDQLSHFDRLLIMILCDSS